MTLPKKVLSPRSHQDLNPPDRLVSNLFPLGTSDDVLVAAAMDAKNMPIHHVLATFIVRHIHWYTSKL